LTCDVHTHRVALVGLVDSRGWLLMQERDEHATIDPDRWGLVGGAIEPGETAESAAHRELAEETGMSAGLVTLGTYVLACSVPDTEDRFHVYTARTRATDADVACTEGRQIVFVDPQTFDRLDLTASARRVVPDLLAAQDVIRTGRPGGDRDDRFG
jgi:8-oxo-dGTP diphosphatase